MNREEAKAKALAQYDGDLSSLDWDDGFSDGWSARGCPNLQPVIDWLVNGCDPIKAAEELRIYQAMRDAK